MKYTHLLSFDFALYSSPFAGWALRFTSEISNIGNGGFLDFVKNECTGLYALPVGKNSAFHFEWSGGAIFPLNKQIDTLLMDRFYLGGISPFGLRGFELRGIGPSDRRRISVQVIPHPLKKIFQQSSGLFYLLDTSQMQGEREPSTRLRDAIGGDYSLSLLAALRFNLPGEISNTAGLRGQLFFNAGNSCSSVKGRNITNAILEFAKTMRFSIVSCN